MPYDVNKPPSQASKYSPKCQRAFVHAFNSVHAKSGDDGKAMAAGHAAAKQCQGEKKSMDEIALPLTMFKTFVPTLVASRGPDNAMRIEGVASSTIVDHHGDEISLKALTKAAQSAVGLTIWLNHEYIVPSSVFGVVEKARIERSGETDPATGKEIYDLRLGIRVSQESDNGVKAYNMIAKDGVKLGISIGAMVPDGGASFQKGGDGKGRYYIDDMDMVEASIVSLPANPRSWVDQVIKSYTGTYPTNGETGEENAAFITQTSSFADALDRGDGEFILKSLRSPLIRKEQDPAPGDDGVNDEAIEVETSSDLTNDSLGEAAEEAASTESETTEETAAAGTEETSAGEAADMLDPNAGEGTLEKTRVSVWEDGGSVIEVDTGRKKAKAEGDLSAQDDPENAGGTDGGAGSSKTKTASLTLTVDPVALDSVKGAFATFQQRLAQKDEEIARLTTERDQAFELAQKTLIGAKTILEKMGEVPVGRKTLAVTAATDLQKANEDLNKLAGIYGADVLAIIKRSPNASDADRPSA